MDYVHAFITHLVLTFFKQPYDQLALTSGYTVASDGWEDPRRNPILAIAAVTPLGPKFLGSVDTTGQTKSGKYIADAMAEHIIALGPENVVQVRSA